jgi:hypothetical protein
MRRWQLYWAAGVLAIAGCAPGGPTLPALANNAEAAFDGEAMVLTVSPWPLDNTIAFLCLRRPGAEFTIENPRPAQAAGCVPIETSSNGGNLKARFDSRTINPAVAQQFAASRGPWFLALSGRRDALWAATVLTVIASPIFSPPGPS